MSGDSSRAHTEATLGLHGSARDGGGAGGAGGAGPGSGPSAGPLSPSTGPSASSAFQLSTRSGVATVNLEPGERLAEEAPVRERALGARAGGHVPQAALQAQNLPQPLDVAPRERQRAEPRHSLDAMPGNDPGWDRSAPCRGRSLDRPEPEPSEMPSGTSRLPSRIGFVNVSGVDSKRRR